MAKKQEATTEVATQKEESNLPAIPTTGWGAGKSIDKADVIVPKILCAQGLSGIVADGEAKLGDLYDSLEKTILAEMNKLGGESLEVIIFEAFKTWQIFEYVVDKNGRGKNVYVKTESWTIENADYKWQEMVDGVDVRRQQVQNFYCVLPSQIKENPKSAFPYLLPFKGMSYKGGRNVSSRIVKLDAMDLPSASKVFEISRKLETKDGNSFFTLDGKSSRDSTNEEMTVAYKWFKAFETAIVVNDDSDLKPEQNEETVPFDNNF